MKKSSKFTSLEEDFRRIGLLRNEGGPFDAPDEEPEEAEEPIGDEEPTEEEGDEFPPKEDEVAGDKEASLSKAEAKFLRNEALRLLKKAVGEMFPDEEPAEEDDEDPEASSEVPEDEEPPPPVRAERKATRKESRRPSRKSTRKESRKPSRKPARKESRRRRSLKTGLDRVSNLLESVNEIVAGIDKSSTSEAVRSFASMALIADMLGRGFSQLSRKFEDRSLARVARGYGALAEQAADAADELEKGEEEGDLPDEDDVKETFRRQMGRILDGIDLFADMTTGTEEPEEEGEEEPDGDEMPTSEEDDDEEGEKPPFPSTAESRAARIRERARVFRSRR